MQALLPWLAGEAWDAVVQEVWVAWGEHENLGDYVTASLAWLEAQGDADLPALLQALTVEKLAQLTAERRPGGGGAPAGAPSPSQPPR